MGYKTTTSSVTRMAFSGTLSIVFIFSKKCSVSYVRLPIHNRFKMMVEKLETFSVDIPQFETIGLPGTLKSLLWIFGKNTISLNYICFLYSRARYFISLQEM